MNVENEISKKGDKNDHTDISGLQSKLRDRLPWETACLFADFMPNMRTRNTWNLHPGIPASRMTMPSYNDAQGTHSLPVFVIYLGSRGHI